MKESDIIKLNKDTIDLLKNYSDQNKWMSSYQLYDIIKQKDYYSDLEYYNLWNLDFSKELEQRFIENKDIEIGDLRYRKSN